MSEIRRDEKYEKSEKEDEKEEEKSRQEKDWDEKWRRDPLSAAAVAFGLIWAGLAIMADNLGLLAHFRPLDGWDLVFIGAGLIALVAAAIRYTVPAYRRPIGGNLIIAIILLAIGLNDLVSSGVIWAGVLIIIGLGMLLRSIVGRKQPPAA
jgi:divalent metal cation (Fe/Co/Zn/Cd) transporter